MVSYDGSEPYLSHERGQLGMHTLLAACLGEQCFLESKLLLLRVEATIELVVLGKDSISLVVQDDQGFDGIDRLGEAKEES